MNAPHSLWKAARVWLLGFAVGSLAAVPLPLHVRLPPVLIGLALTIVAAIEWRQESAAWRRDLEDYLSRVIVGRGAGKAR